MKKSYNPVKTKRKHKIEKARSQGKSGSTGKPALRGPPPTRALLRAVTGETAIDDF
jgi:hypothetical protein